MLETNPDQARAIARRHISRYLDLPNYTNNWRRLGFTDDDLVGQGSDRLVDALVAWGDAEAVRGRVKGHLDAGADHVCVQVFDAEPHGLPLRQWRTLAMAVLWLCPDPQRDRVDCPCSASNALKDQHADTTKAAADGWRGSISESPVGGGARVGNVGAIGPRADGPAEMLAELGMVLGDPGSSPGGPPGSHRLKRTRTRTMTARASVRTMLASTSASAWSDLRMFEAPSRVTHPYCGLQ